MPAEPACMRETSSVCASFAAVLHRAFVGSVSDYCARHAGTNPFLSKHACADACQGR